MKIKWILLILAVMCILFAFIVLVMPHHYEAIALIDGIKFGMSPSEIQAICGRPDSAKKSALSPVLFATCKGDYGGFPVELHFHFVRVMLHYELYEVEITCQTDSKSEKEMIYANMLEQLKNEYGKTDGYYEKATKEGTEVGVSYGAVQISSVVETNSSVIRARLSRTY